MFIRSFSGPQQGWSTLEKGAYTIMDTVDVRLHWVLPTSAGYDLFTDHRILVILFAPLALVPDLSQTNLQKLLCRDVCFGTYNYTVLKLRVLLMYRLTFLAGALQVLFVD